MSTTALVISVVVALLVFWLAEEYAEVLGEQVAGSRLPSRLRPTPTRWCLKGVQTELAHAGDRLAA